jgi:DNA mismatch endonuclease (patch repair protein)
MANKGRDTLPELLIRKLLHSEGLRYRVNFRPLPTFRRTADIVFPRARLAVFIDGCFWHGCPVHYQRPGINRDYWDTKVARNRERDVETNEVLIANGWRVFRFWEHEAVADPVAVVNRIRHDLSTPS